LNVHSTAGYGDLGFCGTWTLEITVTYPSRVYAEVEICQLQFTSVFGEIGKVYQGQVRRPGRGDRLGNPQGGEGCERRKC
jgi:dCTP deaminase